MGKTIKPKSHRVNLRSSLPRIHYYQNKWLQVKGIPVPSTNLQLNPYPNTQLDLQCSDNLSFQCTTPSTWLTHQLEEDVGCKFLQFIQMMKIMKLPGYKTLDTKMQQLLQRIWWTVENFVFGHNLHAQSISIKLHHFASPLTTFKIILIYV